MMDFLISTAAGFGLVVGFIFLVFVTIFLVGAWFCIIDATIERPNRLTNVRIRKRIVELMASGFAPPLAHIYGGAGVAVDGAGKRVFLANAKVMKLYGIEDVINVESDFADEFPPKTSAIRLWVRDLESPFFEIKDMTSTKLRQIDSLLSVMLESRAADANSLLPQSVLYESEQIGSARLRATTDLGEAIASALGRPLSAHGGGPSESANDLRRDFTRETTIIAEVPEDSPIMRSRRSNVC